MNTVLCKGDSVICSSGECVVVVTECEIKFQEFYDSQIFRWESFSLTAHEAPSRRFIPSITTCLSCVIYAFMHNLCIKIEAY